MRDLCLEIIQGEERTPGYWIHYIKFQHQGEDYAMSIGVLRGQRARDVTLLGKSVSRLDQRPEGSVSRLDQ